MLYRSRQATNFQRVKCISRLAVVLADFRKALFGGMVLWIGGWLFINSVIGSLFYSENWILDRQAAPFPLAQVPFVMWD